MKQKIVLIGGGGHAKVIIDAILKKSDFNIYGIVDKNKKKSSSVMNVPIIGSDDDLSKIYQSVKHAFIAVGSIGDCSLRKNIYRNLKEIGFTLPVIVHPNVVIANEVQIGEGTFIAAGAVINPGTKIGKNVIVNTHSSIDHDCELGDFVHIAPGATLSGTVKIGNETHLGTGANVIQGSNIGEKCMIAAGATIRCNMPNDSKGCDQYVTDMQKTG